MFSKMLSVIIFQNVDYNDDDDNDDERSTFEDLSRAPKMSVLEEV